MLRLEFRDRLDRKMGEQRRNRSELLFPRQRSLRNREQAPPPGNGCICSSARRADAGLVIPSNFLATNGAGTLRHWLCGDATHFISAGSVPTDGVHSPNSEGSAGINSPTNFAGQSGSVTVGPQTPTTSVWGDVVLTLTILTAATIMLVRRQEERRSCPIKPGFDQVVLWVAGQPGRRRPRGSILHPCDELLEAQVVPALGQ